MTKTSNHLKIRGMLVFIYEDIGLDIFLCPSTLNNHNFDLNVSFIPGI